MKGEQKYEEMVQVLDHLHQYVPTESTSEQIKVPNSDRTIDVVNDVFDPIPLGI